MRWKPSGFFLPSNASAQPSHGNASGSDPSAMSTPSISEESPSFLLSSSSAASSSSYPQGPSSAGQVPSDVHAPHVNPSSSFKLSSIVASQPAPSLAHSIPAHPPTFHFQPTTAGSSLSTPSHPFVSKEDTSARDPRAHPSSSHHPFHVSHTHPPHLHFQPPLPSTTSMLPAETAHYDPASSSSSKQTFIKNASSAFYSSLPHFASLENHAAYFYSQSCLPISYDPEASAMDFAHPFPSTSLHSKGSLKERARPRGLAAQLPHEVLLQIFSYLLPHADLHDPFMDDERVLSAPPRYASSPALDAAEGGLQSPVSETSEHRMDIDPPPRPTPAFASSRAMTSNAAPAGSSTATPALTRPTLSHGALMQPGHTLLTPTTSPTHPFPVASSPSVYSSPSSPTGLVPHPAALAPTLEGPPPVPTWPRARTHYRYMYPCLFVCRTWYYAAIHYLHSDPVLENACDFVQWLACLEACAQTLARLDLSASASSASSSGVTACGAALPPGLAGFSHIKTLRFEHSNLVQAQHLSYRIPVKGSLPSPNMYLRDDHLNRIAQAFQVLRPHVLHLYLSNCAHITDVAIIHLITSVSSTLKTLDVTNCRHIKDVTVRTISRLCEQMQSLALRGCGKVGDASLKELAQFLGPQLTKLDLAGCMRINDPGLDMLSKFSGNYTKSPWESLRAPPAPQQAPVLAKGPLRSDGRVGGMLQGLSIPGIRRQSRGGLVTFLQEIVQVHPNLKELEFSIPAPPSTSTKSIFSWSHILFPSLSHLTSLTIRDCEFLDDANLEPIAKHCRQLQHLILFNVVNMTEVSFTAIVQSLTQLRTLVLRGARYLADLTVAQLVHAECASRLEKLDLTDCFELGDDTLYMLSTLWVEPPKGTRAAQLVPVFAQLRHVAMENCRRISFRGVLGLVKALVKDGYGARWTQHARAGKLLSLHVSGAWEGVTQRAVVAFRERPGVPTVTRDIHLAALAVRGLLRDEFDIGPIGSGGASMLWSILPNHPNGRAPVAWFCRFARSSLKHLAHTYAWVPVPIRCHLAKSATQLPTIPGVLFTTSQIPGVYIAYQQSLPLPQQEPGLPQQGNAVGAGQ